MVVRAETKDCLMLLELYQSMEQERREADPRIQNNRYQYKRAMEEVRDDINRSGGECWVLRQDNRLIGVIQGYRKAVPYYEGQVGIIDKWYVIQEERNRGNGTQLFLAFLMAMKQAKVSYISCQLMCEQEDARQMLLKRGFCTYLYRMQKWLDKEKPEVHLSVQNVSIEPLNRKEIGQVFPLLRELERTEKELDGNLKGSLFQDEDQLIALMEKTIKEGLVYICRQGERVVGFVEGRLAYVHSFGRTSVILSKLCIDPAYRGVGLGHQLIHAFCEKGAMLSGDFVWLQVLCKNEAAIHFYRGIGFKTEAIRYLIKLI